MKDEGICPGNVPRFYFDQVCVINVKLNNNNIFLIFIICGQQMITAISTSMLSDVFCSPTAGVEETQTTSSLRSLASPLAGDQLEPSYTPFNSTVDFYKICHTFRANHAYSCGAWEAIFYTNHDIYCRWSEAKESHLQSFNQPRRMPGKFSSSPSSHPSSSPSSSPS